MSVAGYLERFDPIRLRTVVDTFPVSWQRPMFAALGRITSGTYDRWKARVMQLVEADRAGIRPDAGDADIRAVADTTARDFGRRLELARMAARGHGLGPEWPEAYTTLYARQLMDDRGMLDLFPAGPTMSRPGVLKRLACPRWWRRTLRKLHARTVEACAIGIGLVGRHAGLYASDDAVRRRAGQVARNAAALESVTAANDMGQAYTLAELAAQGMANKAIRRVELLTRIAGFELIAKELGHSACMVTMTCPSRFHKMTTRADGRVVPNPRYDGSTPYDGQRYLSAAWARCRAAAAREGVQWYGFRIAEPQHDGTPHWHCLLFFPQPVPDSAGEGGAGGGFAAHVRLVRRYFLDADSPDEPGAQEHRVDFEPIDWAKGSAVGYVIKYVSKNIDGHGVGLDLFGNDAITSSQRVEAWAATWRIRQFQQIGGAPVGVWRELRRVHPENVSDTAPECLRVALSAVNAKGEPGMQSVAWKRYTMAQGGPAVKRNALRLRVMKKTVLDVGQYGEQKPHSPNGIAAAGVQFFRNHIHVMNPEHPPFQRPSFAGVESERCAWVVVRGARHEAADQARKVFERSGEAASTRIHVNNCTQRDLSRVSEWAPVREYRPRLRRFMHRGGGEGNEGEAHAHANRRPDGR